MIKTFKKVKDFTDFTTDGMKSGDLYYVEEDKSIHLRTNNIDGTEKDYSATPSVLVEGSFTENGTYTPEQADGYSSVTVNVPIDYSKSYLTFEAREDNSTLSFKANSTEKTISYSLDNGSTWNNVTSTTEGATIATVNQGDKILLRGNNSGYAYSRFVTTGTWNVYGNIMSLIYGDNFRGKYILTESAALGSMFTRTTIVDASNLKLVANTLSTRCYSDMFNGCTALVTAPELPATTLTQYCYQNMFRGCTSLTTAPELPATTLAQSCYEAMFSGCTALVTAPELPATTLAGSCYFEMFKDCTSLTETPDILPATRLDSQCYNGMFYGCTSLTTAPELPATTLAQYCCSNMFRDCTSLTTAPELPATTLVDSCYKNMFSGCSNLNYIKALFTTTPSASYTNNWVDGIAASGTFVKNASATWDVTGANGIPSGWTVETA